ncbi:uncharacterized protein LOC131044153 [Cryptomeria japonica]|uniref:uncharacterized protein LOC131044153 n=1 Tax=Cryptomeria japonica TaxID=3369 RepID=UPI0025AC4173|nr:uncharacterized protein LOC131044153 [Cryptomeria japonica]
MEQYEKERMDNMREEPNWEEQNGDDGEEKPKRPERRRVEDEVDPEERRLVRLLKAVQNNAGKGHVDVPIYQGKIDSEEVLGWLDALENYFEYEEKEDDKRVRFAKTKLGSTSLTWWTSLQNDRMSRGLTRITQWARMKNLIKEQFSPSNYRIHVKRMRQNLKQKDIDVMSYTKQFHKLSIRGGYEEEDEKVARYVNGLKYHLQYEIGLQVPRTIGECFQLAIRVEEKVKRRQERSARGGNSNRGRGGRGQGPGNDDKGKESFSKSRGGYNQRGGRGFGQGRGTFRCYNCNEPRHPSFKCPK